jgi:hypothetical protein
MVATAAPTAARTVSPTAQPTPVPTAPATPRPTPAPTTAPTPSSSSVVMAATAGSAGTVLVASSSHMTLYTFNSDVAGSGVSTCAGSCVTTWPPLTVPAGTTPAAGPDDRQALRSGPSRPAVVAGTVRRTGRRPGPPAR